MGARRITFLVAAALVGRLVAAGEPPQVAAPPAKPYFPFPELPTVLWFEDFEDRADFFTYGGKAEIPKPEKADPTRNIPADNRPVPPEVKALPPDGNGGSMNQVNVIGSIQKWSMLKINLSATRLKIPGGFKPADLMIHFLCWAEDAGEIAVGFASNEGLHEVARPVPLAKAWVPVSVRISELAGRDGRVKQEEIFNELTLTFRPRTAKGFQRVFVDNMFVTNSVTRVADILPMLEAAHKRAIEREKVAARDGFSYSESSAELLHAAVKSADKRKRKPKTVLVLAPHRGDGPEMIKALSAASAKAKIAFAFVPAAAPDDTPVGGLDDMRMLFRYNNDKNDPEFVLLALSYADAHAPGKAGESVRVLIDRVLDAGCIPLVSVPPSAADSALALDKKLEEFNAAVSGVCAMKGVTLIECSSALKGVNAALSDGELSAAGLAGLSNVCVQALRHLDLNFMGRKQ